MKIIENLQAYVLLRKLTRRRAAWRRKHLDEYHPIATCMAYRKITLRIPVELQNMLLLVTIAILWIYAQDCFVWLKNIHSEKLPYHNLHLPFKMVKAAPKHSSMYSNKAGARANTWILLQNQTIVAIISGKNTVFNESHIFVKPTFWCIAYKLKNFHHFRLALSKPEIFKLGYS